MNSSDTTVKVCANVIRHKRGQIWNYVDRFTKDKKHPETPTSLVLGGRPVLIIGVHEGTTLNVIPFRSNSILDKRLTCKAQFNESTITTMELNQLKSIDMIDATYYIGYITDEEYAKVIKKLTEYHLDGMDPTYSVEIKNMIEHKPIEDTVDVEVKNAPPKEKIKTDKKPKPINKARSNKIMETKKQNKEIFDNLTDEEKRAISKMSQTQIVKLYGCTPSSALTYRDKYIDMYGTPSVEAIKQKPVREAKKKDDFDYQQLSVSKMSINQSKELLELPIKQIMSKYSIKYERATRLKAQAKDYLLKS